MIEEYFGLNKDDLYAFLLLLLHHIDCSTLVTNTTRRLGALECKILKSVERPKWYGQMAQDWTRCSAEDLASLGSGSD